MLLEALLALTCQDAGQYQTACLKGSEAGTKQVGVHQTVTKTEEYVTKEGYKLISPIVDEKTLATALIVYKVQKDRAVTYGFRPKGILSIDRIETQVRFEGVGSVNFKWDF